MAKDRDNFGDDYFSDEPVVEEIVEETAPEPVAAPEPPTGPVFDRGEDGKIRDVS